MTEKKTLTIYEMFERHDGFLMYPVGVSQQVKCNLPSHPGSDRKPSAHLYPDTQKIYCFVCGGPYNPIRYHAEMTGKKYSEARTELANEGFDVAPFRGRAKAPKLDLQKLSKLRRNISHEFHAELR